MRRVANLTLKATDNGGRTGGILSGYRPTFRMGPDKSSDCSIAIIDATTIFPGESALVEVWILHPEKFGTVNKDETFTLTEGIKVVAYGIIM